MKSKANSRNKLIQIINNHFYVNNPNSFYEYLKSVCFIGNWEIPDWGQEILKEIKEEMLEFDEIKISDGILFNKFDDYQSDWCFVTGYDVVTDLRFAAYLICWIFDVDREAINCEFDESVFIFALIDGKSKQESLSFALNIKNADQKKLTKIESEILKKIK